MNSQRETAVLNHNESPSEQDTPLPPTPARILVVDDESDLEILFRQMFRREIRRGDLSFSFVHNGQMALDKLTADPDFEVVLSDIRMPHMDGLTLLSELNQRYPLLKAVMVTAYGDMENIRKAMNGGAFDFISKPIQYNDLKTTIEKTLWHVRDLRELNRARQEKERAQAQLVAKLRKLDKMKDEFLANTSHELRTPLNGIIGIVESLINGVTGAITEETSANLQLVLGSGRRLSHLVNELLDFSKLKSGRIELEPKPLDIYAIIEQALTLSGPQASEKGIVLSNEIPAKTAPVLGDENRIQQIVLNLIGNAVKFTKTGSVIVRSENQGDFLAISIIDTGIGIPKEKQSDIFEAFQQGEGSIARQFGGTGLGLSISRKLVRLHGGSLKVISKEGDGSTFTFTLPLADKTATLQPAQEDDALLANLFDDVAEIAGEISSGSLIEEKPEPAVLPPENAAALLAEGNIQHFKIMVVDDNPTNLQVLVNHLRDYRVARATNGRDALEMLFESGERFDLILLDVMMPEMSGYEVCKKIRTIYKPTELPVLLLTAKNQIKDLVAGLESGANDYITKPFAMEELRARVKTHLHLVDISRELKKVQETALENARLAGKAEFATSVLHNVGNILSSIKVSCTQILLKLNQSKMSRLFLVGSILKDNLADIGNFLTVDPKGSKLPEYFVQLSEKLEKEHSDFTNEMDTMRGRIFLMEGAIETHLNYAKGTGHLTRVELQHLIDESLAVQSESLRKYKIEVTRSYQTKGIVQAHPEELIHILVNIIKNAIEAMHDSKSRNLKIALSKKDSGHTCCEFTDTGIGFTSVDKLFSHGFSTKKQGHGFGLHYSRRAMEDMDGNLHAFSAGKNKGATFTLEFSTTEN